MESTDVTSEGAARCAALEQALEAHESALGLDHPDTVRIRHELACLHQLGGRDGEAVRLHEIDLWIFDRRPDHPEAARLDDALHSLAVSWRRLGEPDRAVGCWRRLVTRAEQRHGPESAGAAVALGQLGRALAHAGRYEAAIDTLRRAVEILTCAEPEHFDRLGVLGLLSTTLGLAGRIEEAEAVRADLVTACQRHGFAPPSRGYARP
jgi:tetratricopeptide (TPR) repeat protein